MNQRERDAISHMIEAGHLILTWTKGGKPRFMDDKMRQSAIERQFEIMGEAAKRVSDATREAFLEVPWRTIAGMRDRIVHAYDAILPDAVWQAIAGPLREALPRLEEIVE